jgi:hypothetical protein
MPDGFCAAENFVPLLCHQNAWLVVDGVGRYWMQD